MRKNIGRIRTFSEIDYLNPEYDDDGELIPIEEKITYEQNVFKDGFVESEYSDGERVMLHLALTRLTEPQRKVINGVYFWGRAEEDIAKEMGITQQGVHKHLEYALRKLRKTCLG